MLKSLFNLRHVSVLLGLMLFASILLVVALQVLANNTLPAGPDNLQPDSGIFIVSASVGWVFWLIGGSFLLLSLGIAFILYRRHHVISAILVILLVAGFAIYWTVGIPSPSGSGSGNSTAIRGVSNGLPFLLTGGFIAILLVSLFSPDSRAFRWLYRSFLILLLLALPILWALRPTPEVTLEFTEANYFVTESNTEIEITLRISGSRDIPIEATLETLPFERAGTSPASEGDDYKKATPTTFFVQPEDKFIHLKVPILDDNLPETTESLTVVLKDGMSFVKLTDKKFTVIQIQDNETELENGTLLGDQSKPSSTEGSEQIFGHSKGTTQQAVKSPRSQGLKVGEISGRTGTAYLRTDTGDIYEDGVWYPITDGVDTFRLAYSKNTYMPNFIKGMAHNDDAKYAVNPSTAPGNGFSISSTAEFEFQAYVLPLPQYVESLDTAGEYSTINSTFYAQEPTLSYAFTGKTTDIAQTDLDRAQAADSVAHLQLPEDLPESVFALARDITAGYTTDYGKAKALESYLKNNYTYSFASDRRSAIKPGQGYDPVVEFLLERQEGTCGNFSSAMVILARAIGLPARVVVGWAVSPWAESQDIFGDQAHQWVEVAFKDIGWVEFDPTASGGAASRALARNGTPDVTLEFTSAKYSLTESDSEVEITLKVSGARDVPIQAALNTSPSFVEPNQFRASAGEDYEKVTIFTFFVQPEDEFIHLKLRIFNDNLYERTESFKASIKSGWPLVNLTEKSSTLIEILDDDYYLYKVRGLYNTELENGMLVGGQNGKPAIQGLGQIKGTAQQATMPPYIRVGEISGIIGTGYLRTGTGDTYKNGAWYQIGEEVDTFRIPYRKNEYLPDLIRKAAPYDAGYHVNSQKAQGDGIMISAVAEFEWNTYVLPLPQYVDSLDTTGEYLLANSTFYAQEPTFSYTFKGRVPYIPEANLVRAQAADSPTHLQLPEDLPESVFALARDITIGYTTDYDKAKALESYLKNNYTYGFASDGESAIKSGQGYDPIVEFLLERQEGTSGNFSSAMVILARAIDLPARVVVGWAVSPLVESQQIFADQAHQWVEVAFKDIGWVEFEPTALGGAATRTYIRNSGASAGNGNGELVDILHCTIKEGTTICVREESGK